MSGVLKIVVIGTLALQGIFGNLISSDQPRTANFESFVRPNCCSTEINNGSYDREEMPMLTRIYNGVDVDAAAEEFIVYIVKKEENNPNGYEQCAGSILSNTWILTAAHCIFTDQNAIPQNRVFVWVGADNDINIANPFSPSSGQYIRVKKAYWHQDYQRPNAHDNDIALYELMDPIQLRQGVSTICIASGNWDNTMDVILGGWGKHNCKENNIFKAAQGYTMDHRDCIGSYLRARKREFTITDRQICARLRGNSDKHAEQSHGDSGGPLFTIRNNRPVQLGVVNFDYKDSNNCPQYQYPGVYARTSWYINWIAQYGVPFFVCNI